MLVLLSKLPQGALQIYLNEIVIRVSSLIFSF